MPIGGDADYSFIKFEIHYNNPDMVVGYIQNIQLVFYMTKQLQEHELGTFELGADYDLALMSIMVPPQLKSLSIMSYCSHQQLASVRSSIPSFFHYFYPS